MRSAASGWLTPVAGAVAQEGIDVVVILNALRALLPARRRRVRNAEEVRGRARTAEAGAAGSPPGR
jgi:hypothetical protein